MASGNSRYLSVPHGAAGKSMSVIGDSRNNVDRNRVYALRSASNPVVIPSRITDIPAQLSRRYDHLDDDEIIFEGELMKYKPGMKHQYMSRWCQVTKTHFLYFAEGVPYASFLGRPLAVIPLHEIASVKRVCVEVPERNEKYSALKNFQFEIFLHRHSHLDMEDDENNRLSKIFEKGEHEKSYTSPLKEKEIQKSAKKR